MKMREFLEISSFAIKRLGMFFLDIERLNSDIFKKTYFSLIVLYPKTILEEAIPEEDMEL
jgi:hypothetical protein